MTFSQLLIILKSRWKVILSVFFAVVVTVLILNLLLPKRYTATASVLIDVKSPDPIAGMVLPGLMAPGYIATQLDVIQSERVARGVVRELRLNSQTELREQWMEQTNGQGSFESWLSQLLIQGLEIKPSRESSVISISYTAADPNFAAVLANTFVKNYIATTLELRVEPAKQFSGLFEEQAKLAREKLEAAQTRLSEYQRAKGIIATDERMDIENARLAELSSQLVTLQAIAAESASRRAQAGANSAEVLNNAVVATLKSDLSRQEARLKETSARFGTAHPAVLEQQASIAELRTRIDQETARVTRSVGINNVVDQSREAQVRRALDQQRERLLKLKDQRSEAALLLRDVETAQRNLETINARLNQSTLESQSTRTNVSVVREASPPSRPSSPNVLLNTILSIVVGGMLAVATALLLELRDRKLRTEEDVIEGLGLVMLGSVPNADAAPSGILGRNKTPLLPQRALPELAAPKA
jgi:succinoglycan biosynthesis transport protein ExoP